MLFHGTPAGRPALLGLRCGVDELRGRSAEQAEAADADPRDLGRSADERPEPERAADCGVAVRRRRLPPKVRSALSASWSAELLERLDCARFAGSALRARRTPSVPPTTAICSPGSLRAPTRWPRSLTLGLSCSCRCVALAFARVAFSARITAGSIGGGV